MLGNVKINLYHKMEAYLSRDRIVTILLQIRYNVEEVKYSSFWCADGVLKRL
jgi:hypothetical protein